tara:strand:- start:447 stop:1445 length:999 start_codon:yes stop_codon:yes gene_type:complete
MSQLNQIKSVIRHDWTIKEIQLLFEQSFNNLIFHSHSIHRENFNPNLIQVSTLLSIKTGACAEDCSYCSQSARYDTKLQREKLLPLNEVVASAKIAKRKGASRFCMGAAWRNPTDKNLEKVIQMISAVRDLGMQTCVTLGMLSEAQAKRLKNAGLDYYNHNIDTSPEFYGNVITTRTFQDRLDTLNFVREAGINVCSGGILGMGETAKDRARMFQELVNMPQHPESVPINMLVQVKGTPLYGTKEIDPLEFVSNIAVARILMPKSYVRLSAGRTEMSDEMQALCFFAGANSIFYGDRLLTTDNPEVDRDRELFDRLGLSMEQAEHQNDKQVS